MSIAICTGCSRVVEGEDEFEQSEHGEDMCPHCGEDVGQYSEDPDWR
jgi:rRNA maturation endonuclease Nob1